MTWDGKQKNGNEMRLESDTIMNVWFGKEKLSAGYGSTWHRHERLGASQQTGMSMSWLSNLDAGFLFQLKMDSVKA